MSWNTFIHVVNTCEALGIRIIAFTGGEPFLWPHLVEAILECNHRNLLVNITTNGKLLSKAFIDRVGSALDHLNVSVDSASPCGQSPKSLEQTPQLLDLLPYARSRYGTIVSSNVVLTKMNAPVLEDTVYELSCIASAISIGFVTPPPCTRDTGDRFGNHLAFRVPEDKALLRNLAERIRVLKKQGYRIVEPLDYFRDFEKHLQGEKVWACEYSKPYSLQIGPSGEVLSCTRRELTGDRFIASGRSEIREVVRETALQARTCQAHCYSNCSYNNYYYHRHPVAFLRNVFLPMVVSSPYSNVSRPSGA